MKKLFPGLLIASILLLGCLNLPMGVTSPPIPQQEANIPLKSSLDQKEHNRGTCRYAGSTEDF